MKAINKLTAATLLLVAACPLTNAQEKMENVLNQRQQNIIAIACLEAKGDLENLSGAIHTGLDEGLSVNEIKEALSHLYAYTGFPRSLNGLGVLQQVLAERKAKGITDQEGKDADALPKGFDALKEGTFRILQSVTHIILFLFIPAENSNFPDIGIQETTQYSVTE